MDFRKFEITDDLHDLLGETTIVEVFEDVDSVIYRGLRPSMQTLLKKFSRHDLIEYPESVLNLVY